MASKGKQVSKLKFLKKDDNLKLVSINPEDIIDAKELWVYQTKYRKLGKRLHLHDLSPACQKVLKKAGDLVEGQYYGKVSGGH